MTDSSKNLRTTRPERLVQADTVRASVNAVTNLIGSQAIPIPVSGGTAGRTISQRFGDWIEAADYGVIGDSFTDDTAAAQAALNAGSAQNKPVHFRNLVVRISSGLTCAGPGLDFDSVPNGVSQGPGFYLSGSGYTGVTFTGSPQCVSFCIYGNGQSANGVLFSNPQLANVQHVRAYNLSGFGCNLTQMYDCFFDTISVELCGNTSTYAFSILPGSDTSNMSHICRLQVEQANAKAIYVDPSTLSCVIDNIHSERLTPNASYTSWSLGGECVYHGMRFNSSGTSANATVYLNGLNATYENLRAEGNIVVKWDTDGASCTLVTPNIAGTLQNITNQVGVINLLGGSVATFTADPYGIRAYGVAIGTLTIGVGPNPVDPTLARFENCDITSLVTGSSTLAAATFVNCNIIEGHNLLKGMTVLVGCVVTFAGTCTVQAPLYAKGTYFKGNLNTNGLAVFDDGCTLTGTASGSVAPTAGTWQTGQLTIDLSGASQGQQCTAGGTPGTWSAVGGALAHTLTIGTHLTGGSFNGSTNITIATDAVSTNTASTIVARDGSGNFSAGQITMTTLVVNGAGNIHTGNVMRWYNTADDNAGNISCPGGSGSTTLVTNAAFTVTTLMTAGSATVSGQGTFQRATDGATNSIQLGVQNSVSGGMRIWNSVASGEGQIYGDATYGIRMDTNGNARPIRIDGSALSVSSPVTLLSTLQLGTTYVAGVVVSTGTIPIKDSTGTIYNVLVHT